MNVVISRQRAHLKSFKKPCLLDWIANILPFQNVLHYEAHKDFHKKMLKNGEILEIIIHAARRLRRVVQFVYKF